MLIQENDALISSTVGLEKQMEDLVENHLKETLELNQSIKDKDKQIEQLSSDLN